MTISNMFTDILDNGGDTFVGFSIGSLGNMGSNNYTANAYIQ